MFSNIYTCTLNPQTAEVNDLRRTELIATGEGVLATAVFALGIIGHFVNIHGITGHEGILIGVGGGYAAWSFSRIIFMHIITSNDHKNTERLKNHETCRKILAFVTSLSLLVGGLLAYKMGGSHFYGEMLMGAGGVGLAHSSISTLKDGINALKRHLAKKKAESSPESMGLSQNGSSSSKYGAQEESSSNSRTPSPVPPPHEKLD